MKSERGTIVAIIRAGADLPGREAVEAGRELAIAGGGGEQQPLGRVEAAGGRVLWRDLADSVGPAAGGAGLARTRLKRYRRLHRRHLRGHAFFIHDYATARRFNPAERLLFSAAARDRKLSPASTASRPGRSARRG